jgi:Spy/CpxP family protein refolding chaperone
MKRLMMMFAAAVLVCGTATMAQAQQDSARSGGQGGGRGGMNSQRQVEMLMQGITLTTEQQAKVTELSTKYDSAMQAARAEMQAAGGQPGPEAMEKMRSMRTEFRTSLRRAMAKLQSGLLERARDCAGPRDRWVDEEVKHRAAEIRERISDLTSLADDPDFDVDPRPLADAAELLGRVIGYRGSWSARINVTPFAECLILEEGREVARDFTPSGFKRLDLGAGDATVELCWPSRKNPQVRWSGRIPGLRPGETVIISGDLQQSKIQIDRK